MESITIPIEGMTCGGCVASVERVLKAVEGVHSVQVSLAPAQATVEFVAGHVDPARLHSAIEDAGYEVAR